MNYSANDILKTIKNAKNILINMDTRTDYDALSSSLVLSNFIDSLGIKNTVIHAFEIGERFAQFYEHSKIRTNTDISSVDFKDFDLIIFLDTGTKPHISTNTNFELPSGIKTINIDHHSSNNFFGDMNYVYPFGACCSVLYKFFEELQIELSSTQLNILVVGILTDTGFFMYDSAKPEDFEIIAKLMRKGVKVWDYLSRLSSFEHLDQIKFKRLIFNNLKVDLEKKYAYSTLSLAEIKKENIDLNKVVIRHSDLLKYIKELDFSFVIAELDIEPKAYEISLRSKDPQIDVSEMAKIFGGGGHKTGADKIKTNTLEEAVSIALEKLKL